MTARWRELFDHVADGIQTEAEEGELLAVLKQNAEARRQYRQFMQLHSALHWDFTFLAVPETRAGDERAAPGGRGSWPMRSLAGIALVTLPMIVMAFMAFMAFMRCLVQTRLLPRCRPWHSG
ncbi:MAG: hypothetical protein ACKO6B_09925 [Planctomycetia bacterium]